MQSDRAMPTSHTCPHFVALQHQACCVRLVRLALHQQTRVQATWQAGMALSSFDRQINWIRCDPDFHPSRPCVLSCRRGKTGMHLHDQNKKKKDVCNTNFSTAARCLLTVVQTVRAAVSSSALSSRLSSQSHDTQTTRLVDDAPDRQPSSL